MYSTKLSLATVAVLLALTPASTALDCGKIKVDDVTFDLSALGGPHSVVTSQFESGSESYHNTTYTVDVCKPLKKSGKGKSSEECKNGTRVCAIKRLIKGDKIDEISDVISIAGDLKDHGGGAFDVEPTKLGTSDSKEDSNKIGLRLVMKGGKHPLDGPAAERREQQAVIEFLCDEKKTGLEDEWDAEDKYDPPPKEKRDEKDKDKKEDDAHSGQEHQLSKPNAALIWKSYKAEKDVDVLRLEWHTKQACWKRDDKDKGGKDGDKEKEKEPAKETGSHWGFFTWLFVVSFLGIAAYLVFGSWLNYNRYGARGWDLLPHGDTIRDIPYLLKDWLRRVLNSVQGAGSRGGYSAV